ncbi:MAG: purine-nucleoside phosphorylase [Deltaproteobacteria bacterium]|nr:purine-nucleoside phosphorylase [Deltaproteobacteria bacterium]MBL7110715.1 purine-nucleoside phosphorylase [Bacteroidales bacterium]
MLKKIHETTEYLERKTSVKPEIGIILGTGLGGLVNEIEIEHTIPYEFIPNFPVSTVEGHHGQLIFGNMSDHPVVAMQGRFHYYEGYTMQEIAFPVRIMKYLGVSLLILSNASGGLNPDFEIGDLMVIEDHINLMGDNPLLGPNESEVGPRFPDMSKAYDPTLIESALRIANHHQISLRKGIYAAVPGPSFETQAEYRYIRIIGADAVGMSTVPEVITAHHIGMRCFAFSVISDLGVPGKIVEITHQDVIDAASRAEPKMTTIIKELLRNL